MSFCIKFTALYIPPKGLPSSSSASLDQRPDTSPCLTYSESLTVLSLIFTNPSTILSLRGPNRSFIFPATFITRAIGVLTSLFIIRGSCPTILENIDGTAVLISVPSISSPPPEKSSNPILQSPLRSPLNAKDLISAFFLVISPNTPGSIFPKVSPIPDIIPDIPPPLALNDSLKVLIASAPIFLNVPTIPFSFIELPKFLAFALVSSQVPLAAFPILSVQV